MALVRRTLDHIRRVRPRVDRVKIGSTTEADIRRHMIEDGQNPAGVLAGFAPVVPPQVLRVEEEEAAEAVEGEEAAAEAEGAAGEEGAGQAGEPES